LFSGIGGFDLAAQWLGWENVFHCEWNPFGQRVLKHYWPNADSHHDITKTNFTQYANRIDILTGGFPCQPYSSAGKRKGKEDERHLWPEMLRTIREVAPRYVVGENVLGLTNWDGGIVFDEVHSDLELAGYEVAAVVVPAAAVNAPHGRDRVWFVARRVATNAFGDRRKWERKGIEAENGEKELRENRQLEGGSERLCIHWNATDADGERYKIRTQSAKIQRDVVATNSSKFERTNWETFPTQPPVCSGNDGVPDQLDGITFSKWRNESLKAYGNAIVPQVAFEIFKVIQKIENGETL
jgi:DNA (cytosine-5)-methyltransferase 1